LDFYLFLCVQYIRIACDGTIPTLSGMVAHQGPGHDDLWVSFSSGWSACSRLVLVFSWHKETADDRLIGGASCMCIAMSVGELVSAYPVIHPFESILTSRLLADCILLSSISLLSITDLLSVGSQGGSISSVKRQAPPQQTLLAVSMSYTTRLTGSTNDTCCSINEYGFCLRADQ